MGGDRRELGLGLENKTNVSAIQHSHPNGSIASQADLRNFLRTGGGYQGIAPLGLALPTRPR